METHSGIINRVYKKSDEIIHRKILDETILVPLRGELVDMQKIFSLNQVANFIWEHLDGKRSVSDICKQVETVFEREPESLQRDVIDFINELIEADLISKVK